MFDPTLAQQMAKEFVDSLPSSMKAFGDQMQSHLAQCLEASFNKMNLVTRQEFDTQTQVLAKTREKVEALERLLTQLESTKGA